MPDTPISQPDPTGPVSEGVQVTQADRDLFKQLFAVTRFQANEIGAGMCDSNPDMLKLARHRLASPINSARYRHNARGTEYDLIGTAELQDAAGDGVEEGALLAIYRGEDGKLWARRHSEFGDGRFTRLATPPEQDRSTGNGEGA